MSDPGSVPPHTSASAHTPQAMENSMTGVAPKFPPQNFDVPDINFTNSVTPNANFGQTMFTSTQMLSQSAAGNFINQQPIMSHNGMGLTKQTSSSPQIGFGAISPRGSSSSDDSDEIPLAQLARRAGSVGRTSTPSPSTTTVSTAAAGTSSKESSPGPRPKKTKVTKKRKKKDPNEPQKPSSAYALFFKDTQATIKEHNPSASFGEVSKIVASMWEQLDTDNKESYKKKHEVAKKQYLKQLAAYRASQVSQESDMPSSTPVLPVTTAIMGNNSAGLSPITSGIAQTMETGPVFTSGQMPVTMSSMPQPQVMLQQMPPHMMSQQIQHQVQQQQMAVHQMSPPHQVAQSPQHLQHSTPAAYTSPPHMPAQLPAAVNNYPPPPPQQNGTMGYPGNPHQGMDVANYPACIRNGCANHAIESQGWDNEYCSNDCVITHCRDIFTSWAASRSGTNAFPVK